jgi:hypothetical protein
MSGFLVENGPVDKAAAVTLLVHLGLKLFHLLAVDEQIAPRGRILSPFLTDLFFLPEIFSLSLDPTLRQSK